MSQVDNTTTTPSNTSIVESVVVIPSTDFLTNIAIRVKEYTKEAVEHLILTILIYCVLCVLLYVGIVRWRVLEFRKDVKSAKRVMLVIAHPDDECMFFGPTVLNFTRNKQYKLYIMCLSTGKCNLIQKSRSRF